MSTHLLSLSSLLLQDNLREIRNNVDYLRMSVRCALFVRLLCPKRDMVDANGLELEKAEHPIRR